MTPRESRKQPKVLGVRGVVPILSAEQKTRVRQRRMPLPWARRGKWQRGSGHWRLFMARPELLTRSVISQRLSCSPQCCLHPSQPSTEVPEHPVPGSSPPPQLPLLPTNTPPGRGPRFLPRLLFRNIKPPFFIFIFPSLNSLCAKAQRATGLLISRSASRLFFNHRFRDLSLSSYQNLQPACTGCSR